MHFMSVGTVSHYTLCRKQPQALLRHFTQVRTLLTSYVAKGPLGSVDELAKHFAAKGNLCYKGKLEKSWRIPRATSKILAS
jgi:hypothetical protein